MSEAAKAFAEEPGAHSAEIWREPNRVDSMRIETKIINSVEELEALPHGAAIHTGTGERLVLNREEPRVAFESDTESGHLYPHHVFAHYAVDFVLLEVTIE